MDAKRAGDDLNARQGAVAGSEPEPPAARLNLKALRLAVHGWWLGNPIVYKPGATDLRAVARELASAGVASGALILNDTPENGAVNLSTVHGVLIVRPPLPHAQLGMAAAQSIAAVAQVALDCPCALEGQWNAVLGAGSASASPLCSVSVEERDGVTLVDLRFALDQLYVASQTDAQPGALFARADWREVFLARALHALDGRLRGLLVA